MVDTRIPRRSNRRPVSLTAQCRTLSGLRDMGEIENISAEGCLVRTSSLFFKVGARVVVRPDGMEGLSGVVRWIKGDYAGVEFDQPIYGPVLEHLVQSHNIGYAAGRFRR